MEKKTADILDKYRLSDRGGLIPLLQEVQEALGYVSREAVAELGAHLGLPASRIYGVATFYNQFRFQPLGRYHVQVCRGTACHVKGSQGVFQAIKRTLQIEAGQTSRDGLFSLEVVACLGACGLAPLICVNGEFHGGVDADRAVKILRRCRREGESA
ncbi:MAG: NADH-quinone oxidoreductase subunit NuoE [Candidatus Krumholzibacteriia bacterium]